MITNIPDRERALQAQVDALTEELASVEASNRIRGDELARLRDEMSKMQQHATPPADIISRAVSNAKYWMDRAEHAEAELERLRAVPMENIRGAVARGWYHPENAHKEMDVELESAIADEIAELYAAPPAQPAEPDMRHPKIQALIGSMARCQIELQLVEQLLEDPNFEATSMDMEHWGPMHDKAKTRTIRLTDADFAALKAKGMDKLRAWLRRKPPA